MTIAYGSSYTTPSGNSSFRVCCNYEITTESATFNKIVQYYYYVEVTKGAFYDATITSTWFDTDFVISGVGIYGKSSTYSLIVPPNSDTQYIPSASASTYSDLSNAATVEAIPIYAHTTYYTNINVLNPNGVEDCKSAYFDLEFDDGDCEYELTNEPNPPTYKLYGTVMTISNIRPYYDYYELEKVEGATDNGDGTYSKTIVNNTDEIVIHMKYKEYTLIVNPNGGNINGSTESLTMSPNLTYGEQSWWNISTYIPTRTGYKFMGYYDSNGEQVYDSNGDCINGGTYWADNYYIYNGNLTVYAVWEVQNIAYGNANNIWALYYTYVKANGKWQSSIMCQKINENYKRSIIV